MLFLLIVTKKKDLTSCDFFLALNYCALRWRMEYHASGDGGVYCANGGVGIGGVGDAVAVCHSLIVGWKAGA